MAGAIHKQQARQAFTRHGGGGDLCAEVAARLISRLDEIDTAPQTIVDIGGTGATVQGRFANAKVLAADFALSRLPQTPGVFRVQADAEHLPLQSGCADMLWSNLCLEWTHMELAIREAARVLRPQTGIFIFSTLGRDTLQEARATLGDKRVHSFMDMHDIGDLLSRCGFYETVLETEHATLTYRAAEDALQEVKNAGCACALQDRPRGMFGKEKWRAAIREYENRFGEEGRIPATYEIIYAVSWRKPEGCQEHVVRFAE